MFHLELKLSGRWKSRGIVHASITKLKHHVAELEFKGTLSSTKCLTAQWLKQNLEALDAQFKQYHLTIVDLIRDEGELGAEQAVLDECDNSVADLLDYLQQLGSSTENTVKIDEDPKYHL